MAYFDLHIADFRCECDVKCLQIGTIGRLAQLGEPWLSGLGERSLTHAVKQSRNCVNP